MSTSTISRTKKPRSTFQVTKDTVISQKLEDLASRARYLARTVEEEDPFDWMTASADLYVLEDILHKLSKHLQKEGR